MKNIYLKILLFSGFFTAFAQDVPTDTVSNWTKKGIATLLFNQSNFSNWTAGGENNMSGNISVNYDFNYAKDNWTWDNKILASYGIVKTNNSPFEKKTDDRFEFNSIVGKKASAKWSYSAFLNFKTQITKGYVYGKNEDGAEIRTEFTDFMSPGYLTFGPGMQYVKDSNLKINIAPLTSKLTFVNGKYTGADDYVDGSYFGVDKGKTVRYELGFYTSVNYQLEIMPNVSAENIFNLYSNYLEDPQNMDIDYTLNLILKINKYLTTNFVFQAIYDDNAFKGLQTRQVFGVGVNYNF